MLLYFLKSTFNSFLQKSSTSSDAYKQTQPNRATRGRMPSLGAPATLLSNRLLPCWIEGTIRARFFHLLREILKIQIFLSTLAATSKTFKSPRETTSPICGPEMVPGCHHAASALGTCEEIFLDRRKAHV